MGLTSIWVEKSTFGLNEVQDVLSQNHGTFSAAFWVARAGFSMNSFKALGITVETNGTLTTKMGITVAPSVTAAVDFENTMLPNAPQRIRVPYDITFAASTTGAGNTVFPAAGGLPLELDLHVWLQASGQKVPGSSIPMRRSSLSPAQTRTSPT